MPESRERLVLAIFGPVYIFLSRASLYYKFALRQFVHFRLWVCWVKTLADFTLLTQSRMGPQATEKMIQNSGFNTITKKKKEVS